MILVFSSLNKAQMYEMPYRDIPHLEIEILASFIYLNVFKPIEHTDDFHIRKPNDENFLFESEDKKYIYVGERSVTFETIDKIVNSSSDLGFSDIKIPFAYGEENIYIMLHQEYILSQEYENSTEKTSMSICIKRILD